MSHISYQIKLPQFEGPFDLLLFFIERDELDIYNIPINRIIQDFLTYIHSGESALNIELSSEFILFVSTLMRIKAKMLLPRKEVDEQGNEIDPRQELIDKLLEYKRFKEAAVTLAEMEAIRHLMVRRGNLQKELSHIGEESGEGTEIQAITLFKLMKTFERLMQKIQQRQNKPVHTVVQYRYTMEESRENMLSLVRREKTLAFEKIFETCETRLHAIFMFLSMLELVQNNYMSIMIGEGRNNFIIEFNEDRPADEDPYDFNADRSGRDLTRFNEKDEDAGPLFRKDPGAGNLQPGKGGPSLFDDAGLRFDEDGSDQDPASRLDENSHGSTPGDDDGSGDDDPGFGPDEDKSLLN
jgi:segregation and condensation protein A